MRPALCLALAACFARQPEPQPPRTVCNGSTIPVYAVLVHNSTCYDLPADRCFNDSSPECVEEARRREEANESAAHRNQAVGILLIGAVVLGGIAIVMAQ